MKHFYEPLNLFATAALVAVMCTLSVIAGACFQ